MTPTFQLHGSQIFLGSLADNFPAWFAQQHYSQVLVIADTHTQAHCLPGLLEKAGFETAPFVCVISPGEEQKNLSTCEKIWQAMLDTNLDRKSLVLNLGGGVIGDMGGFCAATWKRGIDFVHIPTTLLSMTDAAIGGKLGIDFQGLKNIIGVFRQPAAVFVDPAFLTTLPEREMRSGMAEVMKHALIAHEAPSWSSKLHEGSNWLTILKASIGVKVHIVTEDPHEKGLRMLLNFGHTIGHAIESYFLETDDPLTHGEAIAIGMICEMLDSPRLAEVTDCVMAAFPHRHIPESAFPAIWALMQQDKKNASGKVRMALPDALPYAMKIVEPSQADVEKGLRFYNGLEGVRSVRGLDVREVRG